MHPQYEKAHLLTKQVIGAAIEVHRVLGPGLLESIYERCLIRELELRGILCVSQQKVLVDYKGFTFEETLRFDVLVEGCLLVEVKAIDGVLPVHKAIAMSYMKLLNVPLGLILNFHEVKLTEGISRLILPGAGPPEEPRI
jgi:GxxExxY protein